MIKLLSWSILFLFSFFVIILSGETHWGWRITSLILVILWMVCSDNASKKETKLLKRIEKLEEIHKERK